MNSFASTKIASQLADPVNWGTFYADLQAQGNVPNASSAVISSLSAVFRGMFQDLSVIQQQLQQAGTTPVLTTIYADVLAIPDFTTWLLQGTGLIIFARRIEVGSGASVQLDYQQTSSAQLVLFAREVVGTLTATATISLSQPPVVFTLAQADVVPGVSISGSLGEPASLPLLLAQGLSFQLPRDMLLYLSNSFIFGSLLYDQSPGLALDILWWVKDWAAQSTQLQELFYRSTSLVALLLAQLNAAANGATFVPYLTADVYTKLAQVFAASAAQYEANYQQLSTQQVLTAADIAVAQTMVANSKSEITYVDALLQQANQNYANAQAAVSQARRNFGAQRLVVLSAAAQFEQVGIPEYQTQQAIQAAVNLVSAVVSFGAGIAAMAAGNEAAAPGVVQGAVASVQGVAQAAQQGSAIAQLASSLVKTMQQLKKLLEGLEKVLTLVEAVRAVADELSSATGQVQVVQDLAIATDGADLSAADGWAVYKVQADNALQDAIDKGVPYALSYQEALDILVIYGQSLSAAQLGVVEAGQRVATIIFQRHYTAQKQQQLQQLVDTLQVGQAPILDMMQQFYQKYLDGKSSLFAALKSYQAAYFYWALGPSIVQPQLIDSVGVLSAGIQDIIAIALDQANALEYFNPPPQSMTNLLVEITDPAVLHQLRTTGRANWVLPLTTNEFAGLGRVRLSDVRIWLEGTSLTPPADSVYLVISTTGNYLDRYEGINYQFMSKPLTRSFKYRVAAQGPNPDWYFEDGQRGFVQIDGDVANEVAYAYFQPTPFSEWQISLPDKFNPGLNYTQVTKLTMYFAGTAIGTATASTAKPDSVGQELRVSQLNSSEYPN